VITLCECKLDRNAGSRREVLGQVLEYAGSLKGMKLGDFRRLVSDRLEIDLIDAMRERTTEDFDPFAWEETVALSLEGGHFRLVVAVDQLTDVLKQTVLYLNDRAAFSLLVAEMRRVRHNGVEMLAPSVFGEEAQGGERPGQTSRRGDRRRPGGIREQVPRRTATDHPLGFGGGLLAQAIHSPRRTARLDARSAIHDGGGTEKRARETDGLAAAEG